MTNLALFFFCFSAVYAAYFQSNKKLRFHLTEDSPLTTGSTTLKPNNNTNVIERAT